MAVMKTCPRCKSPDIILDGDNRDGSCAYVCTECGYMGDECATEALALAAWNAEDRTDYRALAQQMAAALVNVIAMATDLQLTSMAAIADCRAALDAAGVEHA